MHTLGGFQTLLVRMSDYFCRHGHEVVVLTQGIDGRVRSEFSNEVTIISTNLPFEVFLFRSKFVEQSKLWDLSNVDLIYCIDRISLLVATMLRLEVVGGDVKVVAGIYQPDYVKYLRASSISGYVARWNMRGSYSSGCVIAMSRKLLGEWGKQFPSHEAHFIPLPVDIEGFDAPAQKPLAMTILSVGRFEDFKTYNLYMPSVLKRLRSLGVDARWVVYGEGYYQEQIIAATDAAGMAEFVEMRGYLPYEQFADALSEAYVFVGMGTAIVEAAAAGVPTILAHPYDLDGLTEGPIYRYEFGEVGSFIEDQIPSMTVCDELFRLSHISEREYLEECESNKVAVRGYSLNHVMDEYLEAFVAAPLSPTPPRFTFWARCLILRLSQQCEYYVVRQVKRFIKGLLSHFDYGRAYLNTRKITKFK